MAATPGAAALERIADVPIYATDATVRRASSLQLTADARPPVASLPAELWTRLGLAEGGTVRVSRGAAHVDLPARMDSSLAQLLRRGLISRETALLHAVNPEALLRGL